MFSGVYINVTTAPQWVTSFIGADILPPNELPMFFEASFPGRYYLRTGSCQLFLEPPSELPFVVDVAVAGRYRFVSYGTWTQITLDSRFRQNPSAVQYIPVVQLIAQCGLSLPHPATDQYEARRERAHQIVRRRLSELKIDQVVIF